MYDSAVPEELDGAEQDLPPEVEVFFEPAVTPPDTEFLGDVTQLYLNEIDLGFLSFGVASAAQTYFNKTLADLSPAEAATLAAMPQEHRPGRDRCSRLPPQPGLGARLTSSSTIARVSLDRLRPSSS